MTVALMLLLVASAPQTTASPPAEVQVYAAVPPAPPAPPQAPTRVDFVTPGA